MREVVFITSIVLSILEIWLSIKLILRKKNNYAQTITKKDFIIICSTISLFRSIARELVENYYLYPSAVYWSKVFSVNFYDNYKRR